MRFKVFFIFIFSFVLAGAHADTIEIRGHITMLAGSVPASIYLMPYTQQDPEGKAIISGDNFTIRVPVSKPAMYHMGFQYLPYDIMLSPADGQVNITVTLSPNQINDIKVENAHEDEAYKALAAAIRSHGEKLKDLLLKCDNEETCGKDLHALLTSYEADLTRVSSRYKGTYTADVLCKMMAPVIAKDIRNTVAEFRAGYFKNVPFEDAALLGTPVYKEMIDSYVEYLIDPTYKGQETFVKGLMESARANPAVFTKSAGYLSEALTRNSREKMLGMFIKWYMQNKDAVNNPALATRLEAISKVMPGNTYMDIAGQDTGGAQRSLQQTVDSSRCTLLIFWSPGCSHCTEEMPLIREMYEKYHGNGFNIYGYCVDNDPWRWKTYVAEQHLAWTNVYNGNGDRSPLMHYAVETTPTLVMIDRKGTILHRFVPKTKLGKYLEQTLNK